MVQPGSGGRFAGLGRRFVFGSVSLLWVGLVVGGLLDMAGRTLLARALTTEEFGSLTLALTGMMLIAPWAGFGVGQAWLRNYARDPQAAHRWIPASLTAVGLTTLAAIGVLGIWGLFAGLMSDLGLSLLASMLLLLVYTLVGLVNPQAQVRDLFPVVAAAQLCPPLVLSLVPLIGLASSWGLQAMTQGLLVGSGLATAGLAMILLWLVRSHPVARTEQTPSPDRGVPSPRIGAVLRQAWPFAMSGALFALFYKADVVLLGVLRGSSDVGIYMVAVILLGGIHLFPAAVNDKFLLARYHRWAEEDTERLRWAYRRVRLILFGLAVLVAIGVAGGATAIVRVLFGQRFEAAVPLLQIMSLAIPARWVGSCAGGVMETRTNITKKAQLLGVAVGVNAVLNLALIPLYGPTGAAVSTVVTEFVLCGLYMTSVRRYFRRAGC